MQGESGKAGCRLSPVCVSQRYSANRALDSAAVSARSSSRIEPRSPLTSQEWREGGVVVLCRGGEALAEEKTAGLPAAGFLSRPAAVFSPRAGFRNHAGKFRWSWKRWVWFRSRVCFCRFVGAAGGSPRFLIEGGSERLRGCEQLRVRLSLWIVNATALLPRVAFASNYRIGRRQKVCGPVSSERYYRTLLFVPGSGCEFVSLSVSCLALPDVKVNNQSQTTKCAMASGDGNTGECLPRFFKKKLIKFFFPYFNLCSSC